MDEAMRQRIAWALGRRSLSKAELAELDLQKALDERRAELKAKKVRHAEPIS